MHRCNACENITACACNNNFWNIDIFSIGSLVISVFLVFWQLTREKKINNINLHADYFVYLYKKMLLEQIPDARIKISFNKKGELLYFEEFIGLLHEIMRKSRYYMYNDKDYYIELKSYVQDLEDYILETANNSIEEKMQKVVFDEIEEKVETIYHCMEHKYRDG